MCTAVSWLCYADICLLLFEQTKYILHHMTWLRLQGREACQARSKFQELPQYELEFYTFLTQGS